jgi:carbonic anhydrase/acetyltransferase-like protein (isoleucine patch superfamily)
MKIWQFSTIWYNVTIRADTKLVRIGAHASIQDNCIITEATSPLPNEPDHDGSTIIGHYVTVLGLILYS